MRSVMDFPRPTAGPGEALVKIAYSGVNFVDTYHRIGLYKLPMPAVLGSEASGVVERCPQECGIRGVHAAGHEPRLQILAGYDVGGERV